MRLHELLGTEKDISTVVAHHLNAASMLRLAMACKDCQTCVNQSETVYACVMRTFPGIRRVPKGRECKYYWRTLERYFSKNPDNLNPDKLWQRMPNFELVTLMIGNSIIGDPPDTSDDEESTEDRVPMGIKVADLLSYIPNEFRTLDRRMNVIRCAYDWKKVVTSEEGDITYRMDAKDLLDTIAYRAKHWFIWEDLGVCSMIGVQ